MSSLKPEEYFYCKNGEILKNLDDLQQELEKNINFENLDNFSFHVTSEKNDYAAWVRGVFKDVSLASELEKHHKPRTMLNVFKKEVLTNESNESSISNTNNFSELPERQSNVARDEKRKIRTKIHKWIKKLINKSSDGPSKTENPEMTNLTDSPANMPDSNKIEEAIVNNSKPAVEKTISEKSEVAQEIAANNESVVEDSKEDYSLSERAEKLLEKTKILKKRSYLDIEKQKESVSDLRDIYDELYSTISEYRKKGKDMLIPDLKLRLIKSKFHFLEVSNTPEERSKIKALLDEVRDEIEEAIKFKDVDLKKEIEKNLESNNKNSED